MAGSSAMPCSAADGSVYYFAGRVLNRISAAGELTRLAVLDDGLESDTIWASPAGYITA